jgi:hypothetical protein
MGKTAAQLEEEAKERRLDDAASTLEVLQSRFEEFVAYCEKVTDE